MAHCRGKYVVGASDQRIVDLCIPLIGRHQEGNELGEITVDDRRKTLLHGFFQRISIRDIRNHDEVERSARLESLDRRSGENAVNVFLMGNGRKDRVASF